MPKILLAGNDFRLLGTRAAVLGKTGASVVCCSAAEAMAIVNTEKFDLIVLCHSLSDEQASKMSEEIHKSWPQTKILQVVTSLSLENFPNGTGIVALSSPEPSRLIRRTMELLETLPNHHIEEGSRRGHSAMSSSSEQIDRP